MTAARLSPDGDRLLCGRQYPTGRYCTVELAAIADEYRPTERGSGWARISPAEGWSHHRVVMWDSDWAPWPKDRPDRLRRSGWARKRAGYASTRRGWAPVVGGKPGRKHPKLTLDLPAQCPQCGVLNTIDATALELSEPGEPWMYIDSLGHMP